MICKWTVKMKKFYEVNNIIILTVIVATCVNIGGAQSKFGDGAKIDESNVKQGGATPDAISSRFLDLGGVISQLFSGFNQGNRGGGRPGLNLPPNSQFYPAVPAQSGYSRQTTSQGGSFFNRENGNTAGDQWSHPNQNSWNSNYNSQPNQWSQSNRNSLNSNYNSPTRNTQGWTNFNNQNNNENPSQGFQNEGSGRVTNVAWSNQGNTGNDGRKSFSSRNEGTLDDFFTTKRNSERGEHEIPFPDRDESNEISTKNSIWGKLVKVPSSTSDNINIVFIDSSETADQKLCVQNCPTTSEYNPVCGTDDVSYFNLGRLICARNCGINVFEARKGNCRGRG